MKNDSVRPAVVALALGVLAAAIVVIVVMESRQPDRQSDTRALLTAGSTPFDSSVAGKEAGTSPAATSAAAVHAAKSATGKRAPHMPSEPVPYIEGLVYGDIDLREARELMPGNLFWRLGSPTKDEEVLAAREEERKRRNEEYGRVLSGDASEDEVRAYYDYRRRLSGDYFEFAEFMYRRHKDNPSGKFTGMLELAMKMHAAKLAELPREEEEALQRSRERAKAREEWRRQQEEFGQP